MENQDFKAITAEQQPALTVPGVPPLNSLLLIGGPTVAVILAISVMLYIQGQTQNTFVKTLLSGLNKLDNDKEK